MQIKFEVIWCDSEQKKSNESLRRYIDLGIEGIYKTSIFTAKIIKLNNSTIKQAAQKIKKVIEQEILGECLEIKYLSNNLIGSQD